MTASRVKGAAGEREAAAALSAAIGVEIGRACLNGVDNAEDLNLRNVHVEVKRAERMPVDAMLRQAVAGELARRPVRGQCVPMSMWRRNRSEWCVAVRLCDLVPLLEAVALARGSLMVDERLAPRPKPHEVPVSDPADPADAHIRKIVREWLETNEEG